MVHPICCCVVQGAKESIYLRLFHKIKISKLLNSKKNEPVTFEKGHESVSPWSSPPLNLNPCVFVECDWRKGLTGKIWLTLIVAVLPKEPREVYIYDIFHKIKGFNNFSLKNNKSDFRKGQSDQMIWKKSPNFLKSSQINCQTK